MKPVEHADQIAEWFKARCVPIPATEQFEESWKHHRQQFVKDFPVIGTILWERQPITQRPAGALAAAPPAEKFRVVRNGPPCPTCGFSITEVKAPPIVLDIEEK